MSRSTNYTLTCPCGEVFNNPIYEYVNVAEAPQLRYAVLAGLLNVATCPACGRRAATTRPFVYSDFAHNLLAYVHPQADAPEEARQWILEKLRDVYTSIANDGAADEKNAQTHGHADNDGNGNSRSTSSTASVTEIPPLQVIFGMEQLSALINASLPADERLGRLAMSTQSRSAAERGQFLDITRKLAQEMQCLVEVEDLPDEFTVWVFGSRRQIGAIMRELAPRG